MMGLIKGPHRCYPPTLFKYIADGGYPVPKVGDWWRCEEELSNDVYCTREWQCHYREVFKGWWCLTWQRREHEIIRVSGTPAEKDWVEDDGIQ